MQNELARKFGIVFEFPTDVLDQDVVMLLNKLGPNINPRDHCA